MPILPRYILKQFLPTFGAGLALFLGVLLMNQFLRLFTTAMLKGLPLWWIMSCFARLLPSFASLAVPMAFLVAAMMTLGHLADTGEVMALRSSGFSFFEIGKPFFWTAAALSALLLFVNHHLGPRGFHSFREETSEAGEKMAKIDLRAGVFMPLGPWRLYAQRVNRSTGALTGVYLVRPGSKDAVRVNAQRGRLTLERGRGVVLEFEDGQLQLPNPDPERYTSGHFDRYTVFVPLMAPEQPREPDIQEMTTRELRERIHGPATPHDKRLEYTVETAARSSGALSPLVFFFIAAPLGLGLKRRARGADFAASLGVMFVFYGLLVVGISLGRRHDLLAPTA
ncbi:MAG TPA: LptF/LptG family permease, partial [Elusimicrobiota bacterium]|nr:LptF/LptG family permease [Elusimicrobiota bacterium]